MSSRSLTYLSRSGIGYCGNPSRCLLAGACCSTTTSGLTTVSISRLPGKAGWRSAPCPGTTITSGRSSL
jgi:hypothetical protein